MNERRRNPEYRWITDISFSVHIPGWLIGFALASLLVLGVALIASSAHAESTVPSLAAQIAAVDVPEVNAVQRHYVEQAAEEVWGVDASPARLAAQIHQESHWRPKARSPVGAEGWAQFMPATAKWIAQQFPDQLGQFDPWDPQQAALAAAIYDHWLLQRNQGDSPCASWAFALSAYNGGEAALQREQTRAERAGANPLLWFDGVARYRSRSTAAWRQNRGYVRQILLVLEPAYIDAGWSGTAVCA